MTGPHHLERLSHYYRCDNITLMDLRQGPKALAHKRKGLDQGAVTLWGSLYEAKSHTHPRKEVCEDSDIKWSNHKWPTR